MIDIRFSILLRTMITIFGVLLVANTSSAQTLGEPEHKVVIQVSSADPLTQKIALNNAANVQKILGIDNVAIEVVAYGPGLSILTPKSPESHRVPDLALQNITFSACGNTMKKVTNKTGSEPQLVDGVRVVPAGVIRIMELQQQGYAYIRP
jgi:hypothetical protein